MRIGIALIALVGLGACEMPTPSPRTEQPLQAILYHNSLNVLMSDASLCVGHRPGRLREWSGQLAGCPHLLPYSARLARRNLPPRLVLSQAAAPEPATTIITVRTADGTDHLFVAP